MSSRIFCCPWATENATSHLRWTKTQMTRRLQQQPNTYMNRLTLRGIKHIQ
jgi:hypothetical protein